MYSAMHCVHPSLLAVVALTMAPSLMSRRVVVPLALTLMSSPRKGVYPGIPMRLSLSFVNCIDDALFHYHIFIYICIYICVYMSVCLCVPFSQWMVHFGSMVYMPLSFSDSSPNLNSNSSSNPNPNPNPSLAILHPKYAPHVLLSLLHCIERSISLVSTINTVSLITLLPFPRKQHA